MAPSYPECHQQIQSATGCQMTLSELVEKYLGPENLGTGISLTSERLGIRVRAIRWHSDGQPLRAESIIPWDCINRSRTGAESHLERAVERVEWAVHGVGRNPDTWDKA